MTISSDKMKMGWKCWNISASSLVLNIIRDENHDIAIAMTSSLADPVLGLYILQGGLEGFKYLNQCHRPGWEYLNVQFRVTALAGGI